MQSTQKKIQQASFWEA